MLIFLVISLIVATGFGIGAMFLKGKASLISMMLAYVVVISAVIYICYQQKLSKWNNKDFFAKGMHT